MKQTGGRSGKSCIFGEAVKARVGELLALARIVLLQDLRAFLDCTAFRAKSNIPGNGYCDGISSVGRPLTNRKFPWVQIPLPEREVVTVRIG